MATPDPWQAAGRSTSGLRTTSAGGCMALDASSARRRNGDAFTGIWLSSISMSIRNACESSMGHVRRRFVDKVGSQRGQRQRLFERSVMGTKASTWADGEA